MAQFVFKLDGVLRHRQRQEREAMRVVAERQQAVVVLETELRDLNIGLQAATDELRRDHLTGGIDVQYLTAHRRYTADVTRRGTELMRKLALAQKACDDARLQLAEAAKLRRMVELLRDKHFDRWKSEQNRREQTRADDDTAKFLALENAEEVTA